MSCCGSRRPALNAGLHPPQAPNPALRTTGTAPVHGARQLVFELTAAPGLRLTGALSGRHYRFAEPGDRQVADPRDLAQLLRTPGLRML